MMKSVFILFFLGMTLAAEITTKMPKDHMNQAGLQCPGVDCCPDMKEWKEGEEEEKDFKFPEGCKKVDLPNFDCPKDGTAFLDPCKEDTDHKGKDGKDMGPKGKDWKDMGPKGKAGKDMGPKGKGGKDMDVNKDTDQTDTDLKGKGGLKSKDMTTSPEDKDITDTTTPKVTTKSSSKF